MVVRDRDTRHWVPYSRWKVLSSLGLAAQMRAQAPMAQSDRSVAVWDTSTRSRRAQARSQLTIDDASLDSLLVDEDRAATSS